MIRHFVEFYSPGSFVAERTTRRIGSWDLDRAVEMSRGIKERHGSRPYGFRFQTRGRSQEELDSRIIEKSGFYWLPGARILTIEEIRADPAPYGKTLDNMEMNGWECVVHSAAGGYSVTIPHHDDDVILSEEHYRT